MADPIWITAADLRTARKHPNFADVKNRCLLHIWDAFIKEHTSGGGHTVDSSRLAYEIGTYSGTGAIRDVSMTDTAFEPVMIHVWKDAAAFSEIWIDFMPDGYSACRYKSTITGTAAFRTNHITGADTGEFSLGTSTDVNGSGTTYYYLALGTSASEGIAVVAGSDPTWIVHDTPLVADGTTSSMANSVEGTIWTAYQVGHNDDGTHKSGTGFSGGAKMIETGSWTGDDTDNKDIILAHTDLDIKYIILTADYSTSSFYHRTEGMSGDVTGYNYGFTFVANRIQSIGTGTFQVDTTLNSSAWSDWHYLVIGE